MVAVKYKIIRQEYDTDSNNFVSLDEFFDAEISHGPDASKGEILYHYQHYENIIQRLFAENGYEIEMVKSNDKAAENNPS